MTPRFWRARPARRGVALILVLWLLVVLGGIGVAVVGSTRDASRLAANERARVGARYATESGIEATAALIDDSLRVIPEGEERDAFLNSLPDLFSAGDSTILGDERFSVAIVDAGARLDVNAAPEPNLARLLGYFTDAERARTMARLIRRKIEGAGQHIVRPLRSLEELRTIEGMDAEVLQLAAPYLTVDGDGTINTASASDTVRSAAFGELRVAPSRLVLVARGWTRGHPLTHEIQAVYAVASDRLVLVGWRERIL